MIEHRFENEFYKEFRSLTRVIGPITSRIEMKNETHTKDKNGLEILKSEEVEERKED